IPPARPTHQEGAAPPDEQRPLIRRQSQQRRERRRNVGWISSWCISRLLRGALPLGLPYSLTCSPLRRLAPFVWLARGARSHLFVRWLLPGSAVMAALIWR